MFAQFPKKTLFSKLIFGIVAVSYIITSVPVRSYANADKLRSKVAIESTGRIKEIKDDLKKVSPAPASIPVPVSAPVNAVLVQMPFVLPQILVLDNEITGFSGANTGVHNVNHAMLNKADGGLYNHSEPRGRLELAMSNMLKSILRDSRAITLANKSEDVKPIKDGIQRKFIDSIKITAGLDVSKLPETEKNKVLSYLDKIYSIVNKINDYQDKEIELLARSLVNKIVNAQLKDLIARSKKDQYLIQQTVLCVGETKAQYLLDRTFQEVKGEKVFDKYLSENTKKIISQDLTEILEGISKEDAQRIGLRTAYEPRWAINTGLTPSSKEIQDAHRFIKDTVLAIPNLELVSEVDYGGSLNPKNAKEILGLPDVDGGLIGGAAKTPEAISSVLSEAIAQGQKKGKILNVGMNWKAEDQETGLKPLSEFEETFKNTDLSKVRVVISTPQVPVVKARMAKLEEKLKAKKVFVEKAKAVSSPIQISGLEDLAPVIASKGIKQGIAAFDWNMPLKDGIVEDNEKLVNSVDTLNWFKESGLQYLYVVTHSGRPSGTGYEEGSSLKPIVDEARRLFNEEGLGGIEVVLLPYDFAQAKKIIDAKKAETANSGKKILFVLENVRMYLGEQSKDPAIREQFEKEIIALTGEKTENLVYLFEAFEKSHRAEEASIEMGFLLFPRQHIAAGINVVETVKVVSQFLSRVNNKFSVVAGGKKFDKLKNIADLGKLIGKSGGELFVVGALADPLLANAGISVGKSLMPNKDKPDEIKGFKDGQKKLTENVRDNKLKVSLPVDFVVKEGKRVKKVLDVNDVQIDSGPESNQKIVDHINSLGVGDGLLLNGGAGVFDADWGSQEGTIAIVTAANEAAKRGVAVLFGGGDMFNAVKMVVEKTGMKLDDSVLTSTAGGALFVAIAKGTGGGLIPVRAVMKFKGETKERLLNIYSAVNDAFPGAMVLPATRTPYIDTSVNGDDASREPALDLSRAVDGHHIAIPRGRRSDDLKNFYETTFLPIIVQAENIEQMPKEWKDVFFAAKKEKDVSSFAQKLMRQALTDRGIPTQDWQERSHALDPGKLGEAGVDVSSIIAIRTRQNDLIVWVPILVKRGEDAAHLALGQKIADGAAQSQAKAAEVSFLLPQDIIITDHKSAFDALKTYNPLFFDALQKGDFSPVNILINIVNKLEPKAMVDPVVGGIEFNKELGVFISTKDTDEKATAPGFGKNLERFRGGLYSAGETCARLYHLVTPNYDTQGKISVVVKNKELQDAVIAFYARMQRHLLETAIQYFNDARVFESLRVEIGDYAQRLNKAVKESEALELSRASAQDIIRHLTAKGVNLSLAEKANIESFITGSAGLFDVLQLAALLRVDTFTQGFRHLKLDYPKKVLASDKPFEAYDGSGRIARTQFAQRLAADINSREKGYIGRYMVASQELKGKSSEDKFKAAMQKAVEMLTDRQIEDARIVVQVGQESIFLTNLIKSGRLTFHAGEKVLAAQLDFQDTDQIPSAYAVHINLDGRLIGVVYCVDIAQFSSGLKTALQVRQRILDNIPRPFIVRGENNEEIFFGLRVDATPGGVEIGDQELEVAGAKGTVKLGGDTLWKLFAKFNLPESRGDKLSAADELARMRQIYNQVKETRMPPEGGKQIVYAKAQIPATLLLPGFNSLGRHLGWAIPFVGGADVMYVTPGSCSTNGASHAISALSALAGAVDSVGPTFHMYTSSDKIVEKNPSGHTSLKSTGAAKGVVLLLSLGEDGQTFFTAIRTPTGLIKGKADIVGGSMFDLLVRLPNNIPDELIVRYLSRISAEFPQDLKLFDSKGGSYTWKETIAGQKTGSILYADFIERVAPNIYRLKVGYDNEMSFGSKENAMHEGIYLDALRNRQTAKLTEIFSKALASTAVSPVTSTAEALSIAKITPSQTTALGSPTVRLDVELAGGAKGHFVVPAGTSTGEDEAKTVGVPEVLKNLLKIQEEVLILREDKRVYGKAGGDLYDNLVESTKGKIIQGIQNNNGRAWVLNSELFKTAGAISALLKTTELLGGNFKIVLYGELPVKLRGLLGNNGNILAADTLDAAISQLERQNIKPDNITLARTYLATTDEQKIDPRIKQIVFPNDGISTIILAKLLRETFNISEVKNAFEDFYAKITKPEQGVVIDGAYANTIQDMRKPLETGTPFYLPALTANLGSDTEKAAESVRNFIFGA